MNACGHIFYPTCGCLPEREVFTALGAKPPLTSRSGSDVPVHVNDAAQSHVEVAKRKPKNARHSKENPNWQTPEEDIACARAALGGRIDLDPFSCVSGNARVGAARWFGPDHPDPTCHDGFARPWCAGSVYENHPGGTTKRAWKKTCDEWLAGNYERLIWMCFSIEQLCILAEPNEDFETDDARWRRGVFVPTDFSICFLRQRVHFIDADKPDRPDRPGHANAVIGIGTDPSTFEAAYRGRGQFTHGALTEDDAEARRVRRQFAP